MLPGPNPALEKFLSFLDQHRDVNVAQIRVRRLGPGFEIRHSEDCATPVGELRLVGIEALRTLAQTSGDGAFRPLKAAPTLRRGWRVEPRDAGELERAVHHLYPGAMADWFVAGSASPRITHFREFTARQSGIYRLTSTLTDRAASDMIRSCCAAERCLKRRLWTVPTLHPDAPDAKSLIPCLEPCAVLLEWARKAVLDSSQSP